MTAVADYDLSNPAQDLEVSHPPYPFWLGVIQLTGTDLAADDGSPLNGFFILTPSVPVYVAGWGVFEGSATLTVTSGKALPVYIPCTDSVVPSFTYTITSRLQIPDAVNPAPLTGVSVPHTLGPVVDISALL